jgi:hypothetical protein
VLYRRVVPACCTSVFASAAANAYTDRQILVVQALRWLGELGWLGEGGRLPGILSCEWWQQ